MRESPSATPFAGPLLSLPAQLELALRSPVANSLLGSLLAQEFASPVASLRHDGQKAARE